MRGLNTEDRTYLNFDKVETLAPAPRFRYWCCPPVSGSNSNWRRPSDSRVLGAGVPVQARRDARPAANNSVNVFQVEQINRTGAFVGHCAEMCGTYHSMMNFEVRVVSPNDFKAYLQQRIAGRRTPRRCRRSRSPRSRRTTHPFDTRRGELAPKRVVRTTHAHRSQAVRIHGGVLRLLHGAYGVLTELFATGGIEWAGTTALALTGGMALIVATFFRFVARRLDTRPEDTKALRSVTAQENWVSSAPHSWWPILIALSGSVTAVGIALWLPWLIVAGVVFILGSVAGLVFEYYVGPERH